MFGKCALASQARKSQLASAKVSFHSATKTASLLAQPNCTQIWPREADKRKGHERLGERGCSTSCARGTVAHSVMRSITHGVVRNVRRSVFRAKASRETDLSSKLRSLRGATPIFGFVYCCRIPWPAQHSVRLPCVFFVVGAECSALLL